MARDEAGSHLAALFGLADQVALVVGASSGLGRECAHALAKAGARVGLAARREDRLAEVARECEKLGATSHAVRLDATDADAIAPALDAVESALGPIRILVNAAGIAPLKRAELHPPEKWDGALATNLTAAFRVTQVVAQRMIERGDGGRVVMVSSVLGRVGNPVAPNVSYVASKGALDSLTRHLAVEWARHGIAVNAIAPSYFATEMTTDPRTGEVPPQNLETIERFTPLGRLGRPGEIETAILFLTAPASSYVTGSVVSVDGGWTAW